MEKNPPPLENKPPWLCRDLMRDWVLWLWKCLPVSRAFLSCQDLRFWEIWFLPLGSDLQTPNVRVPLGGGGFNSRNSASLIFNGSRGCAGLTQPASEWVRGTLTNTPRSNWDINNWKVIWSLPAVMCLDFSTVFHRRHETEPSTSQTQQHSKSTNDFSAQSSCT